MEPAPSKVEVLMGRSELLHDPLHDTDRLFADTQSERSGGDRAKDRDQRCNIAGEILDTRKGDRVHNQSTFNRDTPRPRK